MGAIRIFEKQIPAHLRLIVSPGANITVLLVLVGLTLLTTLFSSAGRRFWRCIYLSKPHSSRVGCRAEPTVPSIARGAPW